MTVAAYPVAKVIDTTGAGDQYAAGFLLGVARGLTLEEAASWARWPPPKSSPTGARGRW